MNNHYLIGLPSSLFSSRLSTPKIRQALLSNSFQSSALVNMSATLNLLNLDESHQNLLLHEIDQHHEVFGFLGLRGESVGELDRRGIIFENDGR